ncbi:glycosyltransferase family 4 protein [Thermus albus]|uniref:glycosyltransferase family 4 protein n=1 Tax=Thermus albus TaxID=2908146 RepID=UPI001FA95676
MIKIMAPEIPLYEPRGENKGSARQSFLVLKRLLRKVPLIYGFVIAVAGYSRFRDILSRFTQPQIAEMKFSKVLVFHEWRLAYTYLERIGRQRGQKIFLMSHSPVEWAREYADTLRLYAGSSLLSEVVYRFYVEKEIATWLSCDGLLAPSRHSLDGYFASYGRKRVEELQVIEVPTGVKELVPQRSPEETRKAWGIPQGAKVLGFFGRRHPHKGYDIFCELASAALREAPELVFVSAGDGPVSCPSLPNLVHLGFLREDRLADAIAACDIVIVPNRVNYFDLIILEAMSLGKSVITTRVGGAKSITSPGVSFLEKLDSGTILSTISELFLEELRLEEKGKANRLLYEQFYSLHAFGKRHLNLARSLLL